MSGNQEVSETQEFIDRFYFRHGPCCAGCDWWRSLNALVGECKKSAPVNTAERWAMIGIFSRTLPLGPGHIVTRRSHVCGQFKDGFDWKSLPVPYRLRIGAPI